MGARKVLVFSNTLAYLSFIIQTWSNVCAESLKTKSCVDIALSGGKTPVEVYEALALEKHTLPWNKLHVFMVDERFVSYTDEDSNYGMICRALLDSVPIPEENVYPVETYVSGPKEAAVKYEKKLIEHFQLRQGQFPEFDLMMLGIGTDGHTASIFPGSPVPNSNGSVVKPVLLHAGLHDRITLTLPVINNSRRILLLVRGAAKATILRKVLDEKDTTIPASLIDPVHGNLLIIADREAARLLPEDSYSGVTL